MYVWSATCNKPIWHHRTSWSIHITVLGVFYWGCQGTVRPECLSSEPPTREKNEVDDSHVDNLRLIFFSSGGRNVNRPILVEFNTKISCALNLVSVIYKAQSWTLRNPLSFGEGRQGDNKLCHREDWMKDHDGEYSGFCRSVAKRVIYSYWENLGRLPGGVDIFSELGI